MGKSKKSKSKKRQNLVGLQSTHHKKLKKDESNLEFKRIKVLAQRNISNLDNKGESLSSKKLSMKEILSTINHCNHNVTIEAFKNLIEMLNLYPDTIKSNINFILHSIPSSSTHYNSTIRSLYRIVIFKLIQNFMNYQKLTDQYNKSYKMYHLIHHLGLQMQTCITHRDQNIRSDSIQLIDILINKVNLDEIIISDIFFYSYSQNLLNQEVYNPLTSFQLFAGTDLSQRISSLFYFIVNLYKQCVSKSFTIQRLKNLLNIGKYSFYLIIINLNVFNKNPITFYSENIKDLFKTVLPPHINNSFNSSLTAPMDNSFNLYMLDRKSKTIPLYFNPLLSLLYELLKVLQEIQHSYLNTHNVSYGKNEFLSESRANGMNEYKISNSILKISKNQYVPFFIKNHNNKSNLYNNEELATMVSNDILLIICSIFHYSLVYNDSSFLLIFKNIKTKDDVSKSNKMNLKNSFEVFLNDICFKILHEGASNLNKAELEIQSMYIHQKLYLYNILLSFLVLPMRYNNIQISQKICNLSLYLFSNIFVFFQSLLESSYVVDNITEEIFFSVFLVIIYKSVYLYICWRRNTPTILFSIISSLLNTDPSKLISVEINDSKINSISTNKLKYSVLDNTPSKYHKSYPDVVNIPSIGCSSEKQNDSIPLPEKLSMYDNLLNHIQNKSDHINATMCLYNTYVLNMSNLFQPLFFKTYNNPYFKIHYQPNTLLNENTEKNSKSVLKKDDELYLSMGPFNTDSALMTNKFSMVISMITILSHFYVHDSKAIYNYMCEECESKQNINEGIIELPLSLPDNDWIIQWFQLALTSCSLSESTIMTEFILNMLIMIFKEIKKYIIDKRIQLNDTVHTLFQKIVNAIDKCLTNEEYSKYLSTLKPSLQTKIIVLLKIVLDCGVTRINWTTFNVNTLVSTICRNVSLENHDQSILSLETSLFLCDIILCERNIPIDYKKSFLDELLRYVYKLENQIRKNKILTYCKQRIENDNIIFSYDFPLYPTV